jgi:GNAT superfamily N-acetyltransferase
MLEISPLKELDYDRWNILARGYMEFYKTVRTDTEYQHLWQRINEGNDILTVGARIDGQLVGFSHYLFHSSAWSADVCYLQDLFVAQSNRGQGVARALIEHVAHQAKQKNSPRLYWLTHQSNATARILYDKVAAHSGFIRYERPLP